MELIKGQKQEDGVTRKNCEPLMRLMGRDLSFINLEKCDLRYSDFAGSSLSRGNLRYVNLEGANLCQATLMGADICFANLRFANLCGANLSEARIKKTSFSGAIFDDHTVLPFSIRKAIKMGMIYASQMAV